MKLINIIFVLVFAPEIIIAQNLVPNYSFEYYTSCPDAVAQVDRAYPWIDATGSTPDYLNGCNTTGLGVPNHYWGFQYARTGVGYLHQNVYSGNTEFRDYIQAPINISKEGYYCFTFYVNFSNTSDFSVDKIGGLISNSQVSCSPPGCVINENPQIESGVIYDTINWVPISDIIYLQGTESFITIGCFRNDSQLTIQRIQDNPIYESTSIYVDDISLSLIRDPVLQNNTVIYAGESIIIGDTAEDVATYSWYPTVGLSNPNNYQTLASPQTTTTYTLTKITPCDTSQANIKIEVLAKENNLVVFPNPNNGNFQMQYSLIEDADFVIYDELGRKVYKARLISGSNILFAPVINLASAMYILALENENGWLYKSKMVVGE